MIQLHAVVTFSPLFAGAVDEDVETSCLPPLTAQMYHLKFIFYFFCLKDISINF